MSKKRQSSELQEAKQVFLNSDGHSNLAFCLYETETRIDKMALKALKELPHSQGHKWKRASEVGINVYVKNDDSEIIPISIKDTLTLITLAIYNTGSEIGYIGSRERERSHFKITMDRLKGLTDPVHEISGMFESSLLDLLLSTQNEEMMKWRSKWNGLISNRVSSLRDKCNFLGGVR